jgi:low affinity Fe/Cu permease
MMILGFGLLIHLDIHSTSIELVLIQVVAGIGTGLTFPGPLLALQAQMPSSDTATATSTLGFIRNISTAISVVIGGVVFQNGMESHRFQLREVLGETLATKFSGKEAAANVMYVNRLDISQKIIVREAYASTLRWIWIVFTCTVYNPLHHFVDSDH